MAKLCPLASKKVIYLTCQECDQKQACNELILQRTKEKMERKTKNVKTDQSDGIEKRRKAVDNALGILLTAADIPNDDYLNALDDFVLGKISLEELDQKVHNLEYIHK